MSKRKLLSRSALLVLPIALAVAGCQTATSDSGGAQGGGGDGALGVAESAKQDAMRNQASIVGLKDQIAALRDDIMKSTEASERAASAAERAAEEAKAAADKADRIFQKQMKK